MDNFGQFATFPIFFHQMWLRLTQNGQFHLIHNFSNIFPPKWLIFHQISKFSFVGCWYKDQFSQIHNFFKLFPTEAAQNDSQWPNLPLKQLRLTHNGQFWSFCNFSHLFLPNAAQIDLEWAILPNSQFFESFPTEVAQNDPQWPILPYWQLYPCNL